ncbi:MAG: GntR family transcriptional regulator [Acetobacteraceae bacterium]|nr:GntR family transcriptional regulator [Acetobacteraceae bacterium]
MSSLEPATAGTRQDYASASDFAYAALRRAIMEGRLRPGQRMREQELSEMLQVSRTPIREALSRLQSDGLVVFTPRVGLTVATLDDAAVVELYETRAVLEGAAAQLAARYANPRDIATLHALLRAQEEVPPDPAALFRHNRAFHEALYSAAHNRFLLKSLQALHDAMSLLGPTTLAAPGRREQAHAEHCRIVEAIERRDAAAAEAEARQHVRNGFPLRQAMRTVLSQN